MLKNFARIACATGCGLICFWLITSVLRANNVSASALRQEAQPQEYPKCDGGPIGRKSGSRATTGDSDRVGFVIGKVYISSTQSSIPLPAIGATVTISYWSKAESGSPTPQTLIDTTAPLTDDAEAEDGLGQQEPFYKIPLNNMSKGQTVTVSTVCGILVSTTVITLMPEPVSGGQRFDITLGGQLARDPPVIKQIMVSPNVVVAGRGFVALDTEISTTVGAQVAKADWSSDASGQLGQGTYITHLLYPVDQLVIGRQIITLTVQDSFGRTAVSTTLLTVVPPYSGTKIATGDAFTCSVNNIGGLDCWGDNAFGQLGRGNNKSENGPVASLPDGVDSVAAGYRHACVLLTSGKVLCWGDNMHGQVGNGQIGGQIKTPIEIDINGVVLALSAGDRHTCALLAGGNIQCWGANDKGQLGEQPGADVPTPKRVGSVNAKMVSAGKEHTCIVRTDETVMCWGAGQATQSDTTQGDQFAASAELNLTGVLSISAGGAHTCAILKSGGVKCWGDNQFGQLGNGEFLFSAVPTDVLGLNGSVIGLASGESHTCALLQDRTSRCWGTNRYGQLNTGVAMKHVNVADLRSPLPLAPAKVVDGIVSISAGTKHTCVQTQHVGTQCWGGNQSNQLGVANRNISNIVFDYRVPIARPVQLSVRGQHACLMKSNGDVDCWGQSGGNLSIGPQRIPFSGSAIAIAAGADSDCANVEQGNSTITVRQFMCRGKNDHGQLGNGQITNTYQITFGLVSGPFNVNVFSPHCYGDGFNTLSCWGITGITTTVFHTTPFPINTSRLGYSVNQKLQIVEGDFHRCSLVQITDINSTNNTVVGCWGDNFYGQLGDGISNSLTSTVRLSVENLIATIVTGSLNSYISLAAARDYTCGIILAGTVRCWGNIPQFGIRAEPIDIPGLSNVVSLASGNDTVCALLRDQSVHCWGQFVPNFANSTFFSSPVPVSVAGLTGITAVGVGDSVGSTPPLFCVTDISYRVRCSGNADVVGDKNTIFTAAQNVAARSSPVQDWTLILYLAGDNDLDEPLADALDDLRQLTENSNVNIVVQIDRNKNIPNLSSMRRYVIQGGEVTEPPLASFDMGERSTSDPQMLANLVEWAHKTLPAEHYYLSIANHGSGLSGIAFDDTTSPNGSPLTLKELQNALRVATHNGEWQLDVLHLDACLMAMLDNAYALKNYANFLIASQNLGWSTFAYKDYVSIVSTSGEVAPRDLAIQIADKYFNNKTLDKKPRTISVLDLSAVDAVYAQLNRSYFSLGNELYRLLSSSNTSVSNRETLSAIITSTQHNDSNVDFKLDYNDDYLDLYDFAEKISQVNTATLPAWDSAKSAAIKLTNLLSNSLIVTSSATSGQWAKYAPWVLSKNHGVSVFLPRSTDSCEYKAYIDLSLFEDNLDYWNNFLRVFTGTPVAPPTDCRRRVGRMLSPFVKEWLPLAAKNYATKSDLVVSFALNPSKTTYIAGEPVEVVVTVTNQGQAIAGQFYLDFYINPKEKPTRGNQIWSDLCAPNRTCYGIAWYHEEPLAPGQNVVFRSTMGYFEAGNSKWFGWLPTGTTDVYAYVDTYNGQILPSSNGAVDESDETNNIAELHGLTVNGVDPKPKLKFTHLNLSPRHIVTAVTK